MKRPQGARTPVRPADLHRKVKNLNVRHNVDWDDPGYLTLETWRACHSTKYRLIIKTVIGRVHGTDWLKASEVIEDLTRKDWRRVLKIAKGETRWA